MVSALNLHLHLDLPRGDYMAWVRIINGFLTEYDICFMFCSVKNIKNNLRFMSFKFEMKLIKILLDSLIR